MAHKGYQHVEDGAYCPVEKHQAYEDAYHAAFPTAEDEDRFLEKEGMDEQHQDPFKIMKGIVGQSWNFKPCATLMKDDEDDEE